MSEDHPGSLAEPSPTPTPRGSRWRRLPSLSTQVLVALALGIATGVFLGELAAPLRGIGNVFIALLQMTVLPYVVISLILGLGRLSWSEARLLAARGGLFILLFWGIGLASIVAMAMALPNWPSASFFSSSLVESAPPFDFVALYIPSNPFYSLTNAIVPAIVLFSLAVGLALIGVPRKQTFLENLDVLAEAIMRIAQFVARLAPIGVFALVAAAAGTLGVADLGRLQVYLLTYMGASLVLSFWVLPGMVALLTPIPYRRVLAETQDALVTAFATGNLLIVLPLLSDRVKVLLGEVGLCEPDSESAADLVVPINFTMPNLGKLLSMAFVPFAAWFAGVAVGAEQYPKLLASGLVSFFGEVVVALPFLLDQLRIPADLFQVFLAVDVFTGRFGTLLAGAHTVALALLTAAAVGGGLRIRWPAIGRYALVSVVSLVAILGGLRVFFEVVVPQEYRQYHALVHMEQAVEHVPTRRLTAEEAAPPTASDAAHRLATIRHRGTLRAGFTRDSLPFVYSNAAGNLVGLEVDMVNLLARDLGVGFDLVRVGRDDAVAALRSGRIDVMLGGLLVTPERAVRVEMSEPYMNATLSFVVRDSVRRQFERVDQIAARAGLRIAALDIPHYLSLVKTAFPRARVEIIDTPRAFFTAPEGTYDALLFSAEAGSAWTLVYPDFSVVVPRPSRVAAPVGLALPPGARDLDTFVNTWIRLKKGDRTLERLYANWILGKGAKPETPRWSVIRNVLGWVD